MKKTLFWGKAAAFCTLLCVMLASCTATVNSSSTGSSASQDISSSGQAGENGQAAASSEEKPEPASLSIWTALDGKSAQTLSSYGDQAAFQEIEKRTGIHISFQHPPVGQEKEQFSLIISAGNKPDMIYYDWVTGYPGGPDKAVSDGVILKLNDLIEQYAPNLKGWYDAYPQTRKDSITDQGTFFCMPRFANTGLLDPDNLGDLLWLSPQMRQDWMDKLSITAPTTIDEWKQALIAIRDGDPNGNGKADEIPFVSSNSSTVKGQGLKYLATGFGILYEWYMDPADGTIKFAPLEPAFRDYVETLADWYAEGLIDPEYLATDDASFKTKVTSGIAGSYIGSGGGNYLYFNNQMKEIDPAFKLTSVPWPKAPDGVSYTAQAEKSTINVNGLAVTTDTQYPEACVKWADFLYSEEGSILMNWGIEGVSYQKDGDRLVYTEQIAHNPDGLDPDSALSYYAMGGTTGWAGIQLFDRYYHSTFDISKMQDYYGANSKTSMDLTLPNITYTEEESQKMAGAMEGIRTYVDETFHSMVMGRTSLESYDAFVQHIKDMGIEEMVSIQNAALQRYQNR